jgi:hypothetical protein
MATMAIFGSTPKSLSLGRITGDKAIGREKRF